MNLGHVVETQWRAVVVVIILLSLGGLIAMTQVPLSLFPQTNFPRIIIVVENGEVPAPQMLVTVTRPIEEAMSGMPGIARVKSVTSRGAAEIDLFFDWRGNIEQTLQMVQSRVSSIATTLPPTARIKRVERLTFAVFPIVGYSVTSTKRDTGTLRTMTETILRPPLARVPGVATVMIQGGDVREYHVSIDPARLESRGLSVPQVVDALKSSNVIDSPGLIDENHQLELALVSGQATRLDDIAHIVVANVNNVPVLVSDVATVGPGFEPKYTIVSADGQDAVLINVLRQPTANTAAVVDAVKAQLDQLKPMLPKDVQIKPFYDQSLLVRGSVGSVRDAILIGLVLSVLIVYGFLRSIGTTFVAVLVIPVTLLVTILAMWLVGLSFDLMTLGGMAAAIGLVIDDAIVVVENIYAHAAAGASRTEAVGLAMREITGPIVFSTITPVVVFLPLSLLTGVTGVFFRSLALTMAVALLMSLVLALFFTPVLAQRFVSSSSTDPTAKTEEEQGGRILHRGLKIYERLLELALRNSKIVLILIVALLAVAYLIYRGLGSEFLPEFDEGAFILDYVAPPGASLQETDRLLHHVERLLEETPDVESYSRRTGMQLGLAGVTEPNTGDFAVKMRNKHRPTDEVMSELRQKIESTEPTLRVEFIGILSDLIGDLASSPSPVEIRLFSEDTTALQRTAKQVAESIGKVNGVVEIFNGIVVSGPAVTFRVDPQRAAAFGVTAADNTEKIESTEPTLRVEFIGILSDLIGDLASSPSPVEIRLFSEDTTALQRTAKQVAESIGKVNGVVEIFNGIVVSGPAVTFRVDPQRAAAFGVTAADITETIEAALGGTPASNILERGRSIGVRVILPGDYRSSLDQLRSLRVHSPVTNGFVRVDQVSAIEYDPGQTEIHRDGLRQSIAVTARLEGVDLGSAISAIRTQLGKDVHLPAGMTLEYGGLYQEQQASFRELAMTLGLAIALVFLVLLIEFRSFAHPVAIVTGAVLALTGTLLALLITRTTLNVVSLMGMIMIVGIVAKNGILMLDTVEDHLEAGDDLHAALVRSGRRRFRPVLMTSLAAMLGMLPLALALGSGSELLQPLAIAVIGGLASALLLSLVVTPTVYALARR